MVIPFLPIFLPLLGIWCQVVVRFASDWQWVVQFVLSIKSSQLQVMLYREPIFDGHCDDMLYFLVYLLCLQLFLMKFYQRKWTQHDRGSFWNYCKKAWRTRCHVWSSGKKLWREDFVVDDSEEGNFLVW